MEMRILRVRKNRAMNISTALGLSLALPFLLAGNVPATRLVFAPAAGTSLSKSFESKSTLTLDDMQMTGLPGAAPEIEMDMKIDQTWSVIDDYTKMTDGRPSVLVRTFDAIGSKVDMSMSMEFMGQAQENSTNVEGKSELEGKKVVFTWDAKESAYTKAFDPTGPEEKLLDGLTEDADFRALLPNKEVAENDEWSVDTKELSAVFNPCGNLSIVPEEKDGEDPLMGSNGLDSMSELMTAIEGEAKARFAGMREVEGQSYAVIAVEFKVKSQADLTEKVKEQMESSGQELPVTLEKVDMEWSSEGKGELLWNVKEGHFVSFEMDAETTLKSVEEMSIDAGGRQMSLTQTRNMSGSTAFVAKAK